MAATKQQIDAVAIDVLKKYIEYNRCDWKAFAIDPFELAKMLDIEIEVRSLGSHNAIAYTYATFVNMPIEYCYDVEDNSQSLAFDGRTIVINSDISNDKTSLVNMAVMYCVAVHLVHRIYKLTDYGVCLYFTDENDLNDTQVWEVTALTKELLMPSSILRKLFRSAYGTEHLEVINSVLTREKYLKLCAIATLFKVTPDVLAVRCQQLRLLDDYIRVK